MRERGGAEEAVVKLRWYSHGLNRLSYYRLAHAASVVLPRPVRLVLARAVARAAMRALPTERQVVRSNLGRVLAGRTPRELDEAVRGTFANFGAFFADFLVLNRAGPERLSPYVGRRAGDEHVDEAFAAGRGAVLLTAHLGNWELGGRLLASRSGVPRTHVVLSVEEDAALEGRLRVNAPDLRFVTRRHPTSTLGLLAALRRGEAVAMQGDRPTGERGDRWVPFFGEPAAFPIGPFLLARAAGAPVIPAFCTMAGDGRYRVDVEAPIWVKPGEEMAGLETMVAALERAVRAHPTQWFNFFDVWAPPVAAA
ncbi:MAG TPA: lysophospholipid acyltransferase family protein [Candidatus Bathyarchaeia archaeon]|nr:lysophospholipid acyltransferase family protein [Candidatus Bathyarchaeia archaeon]